MTPMTARPLTKNFEFGLPVHVPVTTYQTWIHQFVLNCIEILQFNVPCNPDRHQVETHRYIGDVIRKTSLK
jgi:hypothetical protein